MGYTKREIETQFKRSSDKGDTAGYKKVSVAFAIGEGIQAYSCPNWPCWKLFSNTPRLQVRDCIEPKKNDAQRDYIESIGNDA
jgi:hypothetical protein